MEFCSECESMLVPKEEGSNILKCPKCGNEEKVNSENDYKIKEEKRKEKSNGVAVVEEEKKKNIKRPEYDIDDDVKAKVLDETY